MTSTRPALAALFALGCAAESTAPAPTDPVVPIAYQSGGTTLANLTALDLDGDGHRDLVAIARGDESVRILAGRTGGAFDAAVQIPAGDDAIQAAAGDVNGDGIRDLLVIGHLTNEFSVRIGLGNGQFAPAVTYPLRHHGNRFVVADFNGDGFDDVVASHDGSGAPIVVTAFLGSSSGALRQVWETSTDFFTTQSIATGDFDGDGKRDVAIAIGDNRASVLVLRGLGTGEFAPPVALVPLSPETHVSDGTTSLAVGDLNGDGRDDIVVSCFGLSNRLAIRLSTASGFAEPVAIALPSPVAVALGDINGDHRLDIVAANIEQGTVSLMLANGDGTFQSPVTIAMGPEPASLAVGDFDGNGLADVAVASLADGAIRVLLNPAHDTHFRR